MMVNMNYAQMVSVAKSQLANQVDFVKGYEHPLPVAPKTDTVTLSDAAIAKMQGENYSESAPTYIKPETAQSLLAANKAKTSTVENKVTDNRFNDMMQKILDKRLGIDREKLAELEAMIKNVAENEKMSPEEKQKAIEELEKMREEIIEQSINIKETATETFSTNSDS